MKKNKNQLKIPNIYQGIDISQLTRPNPTTDKLKDSQIRKITKFSDEYMKFLDNVKIAPDVVKSIYETCVEKNLDIRNYYSNEDKTAFALVKRGKRPLREGMRLLYAHTDSPCLRAKVNAPLLEWDPEEQPLHTGVEIDTFSYGGINPHQWTGKSLKLKGWAIINGKRKEINLPVYSPEICAHTDTRGEQRIEFKEAHTEESIDLITGYKNVKSLLNKLRFKGKEDFARARLFIVPDSKSRRIGPHYIVGYGHDNKSGIFTSVEAFLESNPEYTSMIFGFDKEEAGSKGPGGAQSKFFDRVFNTVLLKQGVIKSLEDLTEALRLDIFSKSIAINADVDVGATNREVDNVDSYSVAKLGYGTFINCVDGFSDGDQISPALIDKIMNLFKGKDIVFQPIGSSLPADRAHYETTMNCFFSDRGIPTINIGVATGCLHSPEEIIHEGDLFNAFKAYKEILR